jgi:hypothetical protein
MAACLFRNCTNSSVITASSRAVRPFGLRRPATAVSPQRWAQQQQQLRSLSIVQSFDGDAGKALKEAAALDELIDVMVEAKSQQEVGRLLFRPAATAAAVAAASLRAFTSPCISFNNLCSSSAFQSNISSRC